MISCRFLTKYPTQNRVKWQSALKRGEVAPVCRAYETIKIEEIHIYIFLILIAPFHKTASYTGVKCCLMESSLRRCRKCISPSFIFVLQSVAILIFTKVAAVTAQRSREILQQSAGTFDPLKHPHLLFLAKR